jgi:hypothetical protein
MRRETLTAPVTLAELVSLDHRPHCAVEDQDPAIKKRSQPRSAVSGSRLAVGNS